MIRVALITSLVASVGCGATTNRPSTPTASAPSTTTPSGPTQANTSDYGVIPVGQELDVRLQNALSSDTAKVEQRFDATTAVDLMQGNQVLVPAGSVVHGVVSAVHPAGRIERAGSLTLSFDGMRVNGREVDMRGSATQVFQSRGIRDEAGTAGVGAGVGGAAATVGFAEGVGYVAAASGSTFLFRKLANGCFLQAEKQTGSAMAMMKIFFMELEYLSRTPRPATGI